MREVWKIVWTRPDGNQEESICAPGLHFVHGINHSGDLEFISYNNKDGSPAQQDVIKRSQWKRITAFTREAT